MPAPLPHDVRQRVADAIRAGRGRNEIARTEGISTGAVTKIAETERLTFTHPAPTVATRARQVDSELARLRREQRLLEAALSAQPTRQNGRPTKTWERLSYAMYNNDRHATGRTYARAEAGTLT